MYASYNHHETDYQVPTEILLDEKMDVIIDFGSRD